MARMQRKKPTEKKKKNKSEVGSGSGSEPAEQTAAAPAAAGTPSAAEAGQKKQKSSYQGSGRPGTEQTFVVKLVDRYFGNWIQFLREVKVELSRVTWPERKETVGTTAVVLVFVFIIAIFLGAVDLVLSSLVRLIL